MNRGSIRKRGENSWAVLITVGKKINSKGKLVQDQKWYTVRGTREDAEKKLSELLYQVDTNQYIEPKKITFGKWLEEWISKYVENSTKKKLRTRESYAYIVKKHLIPKLGHIQLQKLKPGDLQSYYNTSTLSTSTLEQHHAVIHQALKVAIIEGLILTNPASLVPEKPKADQIEEMQTWNEEEIQKFLVQARQKGIHCETFYSMLIDTGMRKGEICGLKWSDVSLEENRISIYRTLLKAGTNPVEGPPKNKKIRNITISQELCNLLKKHKVEQNKLKLQLGEKYKDRGYVFAKKNGNPLQLNNIAENEFNKLIEKAGVKRIRIHDLRHTASTLMLSRGIHPKVVSERLGHSDVAITLNRYSHVTPNMQKETAQLMGNFLLKSQ